MNTAGAMAYGLVLGSIAGAAFIGALLLEAPGANILEGLAWLATIGGLVGLLVRGIVDSSC